MLIAALVLWAGATGSVQGAAIVLAEYPRVSKRRTQGTDRGRMRITTLERYEPDRMPPISIPGPTEPGSLSTDAASLEILRAAIREYGDLVRFVNERGTPSYFVNRPGLIRQILVRQHSRYEKGRDFERVRMLLGNGIIVSDGEVWRRHRRMMQPAFTRRAVDTLTGAMTLGRESLRNRWRRSAEANEMVDITKDMSEFALEVILRAIFGEDYQPVIVEKANNPFSFLSDEFARDMRAVTRLRGVRKLVQEIIDERRSTHRSEADFLSALLSARDKDDKGLSDREVIDEVMTLVVAGYETTAGTLNWAWYEIGQHPEVEQQLLAEARAMLAETDERTAAVLPALPKIRAVLDETLRLYPPVWLYSRRVREEDELDGVTIEQGANIFLSPYLIHRSESLWPDAEEFNPDRFLTSENLEGSGHYIPFSLGPRRCIGEHFSFLEMQLLLAEFLAEFELRPVTDVHPGMELGINLRAQNAITMTIRFRESANG